MGILSVMNITDTLKKMLRRTERDVLIAGAALGSVSAMSKLFPVMEGCSTLRVIFNDGGWVSWDCVPVNASARPWNDFLKWYHGRPQSEAYVMRYKDGSRMFKRCDVRWYSINYAERVKETRTR